MSLIRKENSPNCHSESEKKDPSVIYTFYSEKLNITPQLMYSCQNSNLDEPDEITLEHMRKLSEDFLFKKTSTVKKVDLNALQYLSNPLINENDSGQDDGKELMKHKMSSSCAPHYDLKRVTSYNKYSCNYLGTGIDDTGRLVKNPLKTWTGTLPSCDDSVEISENLELDVKKLVYERAGGDESKLNLNEFICNIMSLPLP